MHFAGFGGWFLTYQPVNPETPPPKQPFLISNCGPEIKGIKSAPLHRKWLLRAAVVPGSKRRILGSMRHLVGGYVRPKNHMQWPQSAAVPFHARTHATNIHRWPHAHHTLGVSPRYPCVRVCVRVCVCVCVCVWNGAFIEGSPCVAVPSASVTSWAGGR